VEVKFPVNLSGDCPTGSSLVKTTRKLGYEMIPQRYPYYPSTWFNKNTPKDHLDFCCTTSNGSNSQVRIIWGGEASEGNEIS